MKTIVVPTDFSKEADFALTIATAIARKTKATISLMHVIQSLYEKEYAASAELPDEGWQRLEDRIVKAEAQLTKTIKGHRETYAAITPNVKVGSVFEEIPEIIGQCKADLIVMGTKGDEGLHELLIGSNVEKVVRYAHIPVLSVSRKIENFDLQQVVFATNFDERATPLLTLLNQWQLIFGFKLHLVYVNTPLIYSTTAKIEAQQEKFLKKHPLTNYTTAIVDDYTERDGIQQYARKVKADMVAMLTHGRDGVSYLLDGSITEDAVNHLPLPVLTYNIHSDN